MLQLFTNYVKVKRSFSLYEFHELFFMFFSPQICSRLLHFHRYIYSQVHNTPSTDLTNLCVMVLLQQAISWALAFESVVWDVPRIAENQSIHYHFVKASMCPVQWIILLFLLISWWVFSIVVKIPTCACFIQWQTYVLYVVGDLPRPKKCT